MSSYRKIYISMVWITVNIFFYYTAKAKLFYLGQTLERCYTLKLIMLDFVLVLVMYDLDSGSSTYYRDFSISHMFLP